MRLTNTKAIFLSFIISTVALADAVIFNGDYVKALKDKLKLNETAEILTGTDDPTSVAKTAHKGSLYLRQGDIGQAYVKLDDGSTTNWSSVASPTGILTYVLTNDSSDISTYYDLTALPAFTAGSAASVPVSVTTSETLLASFATNVGYPNTTIIPSGVITSHYETTKGSGGQSYTTRFRLYKRSSGGTETLLITSDNSTATTANTAQQQSPLAIVASDITLDPTDRLVLKVFATMESSSATITLAFDNGTGALIRIPTASVDATNFIPYVGATKNVDLGTKDLTTTSTLSAGSVSATNSSASSQFLGAAGSLGTPSYSFTGDPNTGLASSGPDSMTVSAGGTNVASFESTLITANQPLSLFPGTTTKFPMKFTSGTNLTSPVPGAVEYDGTNLYYTDGTSTRRTTVNTNGTQTLTGKTLSGNTATNLVSGSGTFTLNTSGTVTAPNATDTLVGKATTDTLTNKTLTSPAISDPSITGQVNAAVGTASAPTISFTSDLNTGIFSPTSDTVGIATGGTSRATVDTTSVNLLAGTNLKLNGATSGAATIATPATTSSYTATLPSAVGDVQSDMVFDSSGTAQFIQQKQRNYLSPWFDGNKTISVTNSIGDTLSSSDRTANKTTWGAGNTSNLTVSNSASSPIEGNNSILIDSGTTTAGFIETPLFSITNTVDLGKPQSIGFDTTGNATDADYQVYVVRYNSSNVLQERISVQGSASSYSPYSAKLGVGSTKFKGFFIPSSTSTDQYAVRWSKDASVNVDLKVDSLYVGPDTVVQGAAIGDWQAFSPTVSNTTNNTSAGFWRPNGDSMEVLARVVWTGAGAGSAFTMTIPNSNLIDSNKVPGISGYLKAGSAMWADSGVGYKALNLFAASTSTLQFAEIGANNDWDGSQAASGDYLAIQFKVPIVGWSSNVTMLNAPSSEYGYSTYVTDDNSGAYLTSFGYGSTGQQFGSFTAGRQRRVRFQTPILPTDNVELEITTNGGITWQSPEVSTTAVVAYQYQTGTVYGIGWQPVASNTTDVDVYFGTYRSPSSAGAFAAAGNAWSTIAASNTYKWRVKKSSGVGAGAMPISSRNIVGDTSGTTVPAGIIGERINSSTITGASTTTSYATVATLALTPGVWDIRYQVSASFSTGTTLADRGVVKTYLIDGASAQITGSGREIGTRTPAGATAYVYGCLAAEVRKTISANETITLQIKHVNGAGTNSGAYYNTSDEESVFYAVRGN